MGRSVAAASRVLVVDDDPGILDFIALLLESEGYAVSTACHGAEALERAAAMRPDVVLLDLAMPVVDGWQLTEALREQERPPPLIFMTAGHSARREAERHGADGYLSKPFDVEDLLRCVERVLAARTT